MQLSDTTTPANGLLQQYELRTVGLGQVTGSSKKKAEFMACINNAADIVEYHINKANGESPFDDRNHGTMPVRTYGLVDGWNSVVMDEDITRVYKVEIHDATKDAEEGWSTLPFQYAKDREEDRFGNDQDTPTSYWREGTSIVFSCPVDTSKTDKYRFTYSRNAFKFDFDVPTTIPGFNVRLHPVLYFLAIRTWALEKNKDGSKRGLIELCDREIGDTVKPYMGYFDMIYDMYSNFDNSAGQFIGRPEVNLG